LDIKKLLELVAQKELDIDEALQKLKELPFKKLENGILIDSHREIRTGHKEVIFGQGKSYEQLETIIKSFSEDELLITRVSEDIGERLENQFKQGSYYEIAKIFLMGKHIDITPPWKEKGELIIITAGSSDLPVAMEAYISACFFGIDTGLICDVGVAGIHRLFQYLKNINKAKVLIVVAGMEGALPSVIAGLTGKPILAVPTSVGYGASFSGISALLGMLNSCAGGVCVLNIDNGFGAALMAAKLFKSFNIHS